MENLIGKKFKSIKPICFNTERGEQFGNIEGEIKLVEKIFLF